VDISFRLGIEEDIEILAQLYDELIDRLMAAINYPGWKKGVYPIRENAEEGVKDGCLYVAVCNNKVAGSIILRNNPEPAYLAVKWQADLDYSLVFAVHTFVVHPDYWGNGVGSAMLDFAVELGIRKNIKSLRLDVYEKNLPAIRLYEKCGFHYIDTVDMGLKKYGLNWFKLYEKLL